MVVEAVKVCQSSVSWTEFKAITRRDDFTRNEPLVHDLDVAHVPGEKLPEQKLRLSKTRTG